jgi:probable rRNA maturation factor
MAPDEDGRRRLSVLVADERGRRVRAGALASWLRRVAPAAARGMVSIALVSDTRIRALNRTYRHTDAATDVLSFGAHGAPATLRPPALSTLRRVQGRPEPRRRTRARRGAEGPPPASEPGERFLGEIVIARGIAKRQARAAGHSEATELRVLALHGLLHLLGYDHDRDAGTMRRIEQRLRRKGGLREGLIERAGTVRVATRRRRGRHALKRP